MNEHLGIPMHVFLMGPSSKRTPSTFHLKWYVAVSFLSPLPSVLDSSTVSVCLHLPISLIFPLSFLAI